MLKLPWTHSGRWTQTFRKWEFLKNQTFRGQTINSIKRTSYEKLSYKSSFSWEFQLFNFSIRQPLKLWHCEFEMRVWIHRPLQAILLSLVQTGGGRTIPILFWMFRSSLSNMEQITMGFERLVTSPCLSKPPSLNPQWSLHPEDFLLGNIFSQWPGVNPEWTRLGGRGGSFNVPISRHF